MTISVFWSGSAFQRRSCLSVFVPVFRPMLPGKSPVVLCGMYTHEVAGPANSVNAGFQTLSDMARELVSGEVTAWANINEFRYHLIYDWLYFVFFFKIFFSFYWKDRKMRLSVGSISKCPWKTQQGQDKARSQELIPGC